MAPVLSSETLMECKVVVVFLSFYLSFSLKEQLQRPLQVSECHALNRTHV